MRDPKKFANLIKQAAADWWRAQQPCDVMIGTVMSIDPISVQIGQLLIPAEMIVCMQGASPTVGDAVAVLRQTGGQQFFILGVV